MSKEAAPPDAATPVSGRQDSAAAGTSAAADGRGRFYLGLAVVALLLATVLALFASSQPDGLERVAIDKGFADTAQESAVTGSPLAEYTFGGTQAEPTPARSAAAGVAGAALMAAVAFGVFGLLGRRASTPDQR